MNKEYGIMAQGWFTEVVVEDKIRVYLSLPEALRFVAGELS